MWSIFNKVRKQEEYHGRMTLFIIVCILILTWIEVLLKEYQKDFFAEGQFFYFLKRHNQSTFYRCPVSQMSYYVFPIPDDEIEFGTMGE